MEDKKFIEKFSERVWKTQKSRFNAAKRMNRYYYSAYISMTLTSVSIIAINLMVFIPCFEKKSNIITILTIILSIYVLVINLLISYLKYDHKAENYHACGCDLTEINDCLQIDIDEKKELERKEKLELVQRYHIIIKKYNLNHSKVDYIRGLIDAGVKVRYSSFFLNYLQWYIFNWSTGFILIALLVPILSVLLLF